jgi:hypothetical protein
MIGLVDKSRPIFFYRTRVTSFAHHRFRFLVTPSGDRQTTRHGKASRVNNQPGQPPAIFLMRRVSRVGGMRNEVEPNIKLRSTTPRRLALALDTRSHNRKAGGASRRLSDNIYRCGGCGGNDHINKRPSGQLLRNSAIADLVLGEILCDYLGSNWRSRHFPPPNPQKICWLKVSEKLPTLFQQQHSCCLGVKTFGKLSGARMI